MWGEKCLKYPGVSGRGEVNTQTKTAHNLPWVGVKI